MEFELYCAQAARTHATRHIHCLAVARITRLRLFNATSYDVQAKQGGPSRHVIVTSRHGMSCATIQSGPASLFLSYVYQISTDFQNSSTGTLTQK